MSTMTNAALERKAKQEIGLDTSDPMLYVAVGSGTTAESASHTALVTEHTTGGLARALAAVSYVADYTSQWAKTWIVTAATATIAEIAVFNAASGGTMLFRHKLTTAKIVESGEAVELIVQEIHSQVAL